MVATQLREVDSNPRPFGCKAQNIPLSILVKEVGYKKQFLLHNVDENNEIRKLQLQ